MPTSDRLPGTTNAEWTAQQRAISATCPRCIAARRLFAESEPTLTLSDVPDHGLDFCAVQSVETCGPASYGHPRAYFQVRRCFDQPRANDQYRPEDSSCDQ